MAVGFLQELLVLPLQVLLEDDAPDGEVAVLIAETGFLLTIRPVEIRIVIDLAGAVGAGVKGLRGLVVALQGMRIENVTALLREDQTTLIATKADGLDEPLVAEMVESVAVGVEVLCGHNTEGAHDGEGTTVLTVQLVDATTINNQLALLAARQVEVAHQAVARIVVVPVAFVVHAPPSVVAVPLTVLAWITPSSVGHRPSLRGCCCLGCP